MGIQWSFYNGGAGDTERYRFEDGSLVLKGGGRLAYGRLASVVRRGRPGLRDRGRDRDRRQGDGGPARLLQPAALRGARFQQRDLVLHRYGLERRGPKPQDLGRRVFIRLVNDRNLVSLYYSADGKEWKRFDPRMDVSGYHHNTAVDFLSLRPALYVTGRGEARFRGFKYRALP